MQQQTDSPTRTATAGTGPVDPVILPDMATQAHPTPLTEPQSQGNLSEAGEEKLQEVLPEINQVAQKVGGFKKLSEIAGQLDQAGKAP